MDQPTETPTIAPELTQEAVLQDLPRIDQGVEQNGVNRLLPVRRPQFRFNAENARELGKLGVIAKRKLAEERRKQFEPDEVDPEFVYKTKRVSRVRAQIEGISYMLDKEKDPQKIDRLASAIERLSKLEQILSGRPFPARARTPDKPRRSSAGIVLSDDDSPQVPQ